MPTVAASSQTNSVSEPGILVKENFSEVLRRNLDLVLQREWDYDIMGSKFFNQENMDGENVRIGEFYGVGLVPVSRDADNVPVDEIGQGFVKTLNAITYRLAIDIEQALIEDDKLGVVGKRQTALATSAKRTVEYILADAFNRGFSSSATQFTCADGEELFSDARNNPAPGGGTWSNLETAAALTSTSLWTMDTNFAANTDERNLLAPLDIRHLVVPKALAKKAWEITNSGQVPENAMNTAQYYNGGQAVQVHPWNYLTSSTAWFGFGCADFQDPMNELYQFWRVPATPETSDPKENVVRQWIRYRTVNGAARPHAWRGNAGA